MSVQRVSILLWKYLLVKEEELFYWWKVSKFLLVALFANARRVDVSKFRVENTAILRLRPRKLILKVPPRTAAVKYGIRNTEFGIRNPESGIRKWKRNTETETGKRIRNQISMIEWKVDRISHCIINFSTIIQREFVLVFLAVPYIFLLLGLDKVCRSVGYCTARLMKVILRVCFIHEFMGWIIQLNITFVAICQE